MFLSSLSTFHVYCPIQQSAIYSLLPSQSLSSSLIFFFSPLTFPVSPLSTIFFSISQTFLALTISLTCLHHALMYFSPSCSLCLFLTPFLISTFSLYLSSCLSPWEFGKHSVSLMKEKCCFTALVLFWCKIKGYVKYPPDAHTDIHSIIYLLLHALNGLKTEAMRQYEVEEREGDRDRKRESKLVLRKGEKNDMFARGRTN